MISFLLLLLDLLCSFSSLSWNLQFSSVDQSCPTLCDPMDCRILGLPVHHQLAEFTQTHVHWVGDAIQPSHPLSSPFLLPSIFPSIRVFSNESALCNRWPKYWSFSPECSLEGVMLKLKLQYFDCVDHHKLWKILKEIRIYQTTWPASWEICMQVRKQQLELDMEQQTGSKSGKEYVKAVYCHPAYLTYMQSTSWETLESRLLGEISITSDM